ncbi:DinB family protein [Belliella pelovolcani]|uniref:DinB family protein n=1 Tax=Belliella pelovolcani TaxID=529505 RepID=UPI00391DCDE1
MTQTTSYVKALQEITEEVKSTFGELSQEILFQKPDAKTWSIAENLEHLITLNSSYFPIFDKLKKGELPLAFISKIAFFPKILGDMIMKSVAVSNTKKVKTFPLWEPRVSSGDQYDIIQKFEKHQQALIAKINELDSHIQKGSIIHSPANRLIVYRLDQAIAIIIEHERRHLLQAKNLLD